jgi:hypothetical protein
MDMSAEMALRYRIGNSDGTRNHAPDKRAWFEFRKPIFAGISSDDAMAKLVKEMRASRSGATKR